MVLNVNLSASDFFALSTPLKKGKSYKECALLPDTSFLFAEEQFAEVGLCWHEEGIRVSIDVHKPLENVDEDFAELFFDTRDLKAAGFPTRFCHHFLISAQVGASREATRFRTEDSHLLCDSSDLEVKIYEEKISYRMQVFIPAYCLHGYEPKAFDRLGFTYKINRSKKEPQHFAVSSQYYAIEQHPGLWGSLRLE